jgi:hypothetical protein
MHLQVVPDVRPIRTPRIVQQLLAGDDPTSVVHQLPQNHELLMWQVNGCSSDKKPVPIKLEFDVTDPQDPQPPESLGVD